MSWIFGRRSFGWSHQSVLPMTLFKRCHHPLLTFIVDSFIGRGFPKIATDTLHSQLSLNQSQNKRSSMFSSWEGERTRTRGNNSHDAWLYNQRNCLTCSQQSHHFKSDVVVTDPVWPSHTLGHEIIVERMDTNTGSESWQTNWCLIYMLHINNKKSAGWSDGDRLTPYNRNRFIDLF